MLKIEVTQESAAEMVTRLKAEVFPGLGLESSFADTLGKEVVAQVLGSKTWAELLERIEQASGSEPAQPTAVGLAQALHLTKPVTLYLRAYANDENADSPSWAKVVLDNEMLQKLLRAESLCLQEKYATARLESVMPETWEDEESFRPTDECAVVGPYLGFWFEMLPKHGRHTCETDYVDFRDLAKLLQEGESASNPYFAWCDGVLIRDGNSARDLALTLLEQEVLQVNESCIDQMP
jgi:hypothetical protein